MTDSEKPFACPSPGCNMSFTNEDHLMVHKKKHDMVLNLGSNGKNNVFVADQTPTPTRFIRNCEEVGLFQDLQNVNPFEETFRRAVEAGKSGTLTVPEVSLSDDTLHTPHIFPHIPDVPPPNNLIISENNMQDTPTICITEATTNEVKNSSIEVHTHMEIGQSNLHEGVKNIKIVTTNKETKQTAETIIVQEADTSLATKIAQKLDSPQPQLSINGEEVQLLLKTADGKLMQLSAVPVSESQHASTNSIVQSKTQTVVIKTQPALRTADRLESKKSATTRLSLAKMKLKQVLTKNNALSENQNTAKQPEEKSSAIPSAENVNRHTDQYKKLEILERNRASSMRSRAKRKAWIQQLQRTVNNVNETNAVLQVEVKALRSEVTKLKTLLLAHKDCPVTKAMERGNGIIVGPNVIPVNPEVIHAIPISTSNPPIKRIAVSPDATVAPKKKVSLIPKNAVILPKADGSAGSTLQSAKIVRNLSDLKIVEIGHFLTEKDGGKQVLIVQSPPGKLGETSSRPVIHITPTLEMENAASKSTGT